MVAAFFDFNIFGHFAFWRAGYAGMVPSTSVSEEATNGQMEEEEEEEDEEGGIRE